jgi:predicted esterase
VFLAHGSLDPVVPAAAGDECREFQQGQGYDVSLKS